MGPDAAYLVEGIGTSRASEIFDASVADEAALRVAARAKPGDGPVVALLPDSWDRYLSLPWMA